MIEVKYCCHYRHVMFLSWQVWFWDTRERRVKESWVIGTEGNGGLYKVDDDDRDDGVVDIVFYKSIVSSRAPFVPPGEVSSDKSQPF